MSGGKSSPGGNPTPEPDVFQRGVDMLERSVEVSSGSYLEARFLLQTREPSELLASVNGGGPGEPSLLAAC